MAKVRTLHLPPEIFGDNYLVPVDALSETSPLRAWAENEELGKEMPTIAVIEVEEEQKFARGEEARQFAEVAIEEFKQSQMTGETGPTGPSGPSGPTGPTGATGMGFAEPLQEETLKEGKV